MQFTAPIPFTEAIDKVGKKTPLGSALSSAELSQLPLAIRDVSFFAAKVQDVRFLSTMQSSIGDYLQGARETLPNGETALKVGSRADFVSQMSGLARSLGMGPLDPDLVGTVQDITSERRLALIFDTQVKMARDYGNWTQGMDPDALDQFPAQQFVREVDVATPRQLHAENEGVIRLKTDLQFWLAMNSPTIGGFGTPYGPWGFNSGMGVRDIDREEAVAAGLLDPLQQLDPVVRQFDDQVSASAAGLDPHLVDWIVQELGDQVEFDGHRIWLRRRGATVTPTTPDGGPDGNGDTSAGPLQ